MKKYAAKNLEKNEILVTGHTHCAEFSPEKKYINNGLIRHGVGQYLLVENDTMRLIDENY